MTTNLKSILFQANVSLQATVKYNNEMDGSAAKLNIARVVISYKRSSQVTFLSNWLFRVMINGNSSTHGHQFNIKWVRHRGMSPTSANNTLITADRCCCTRLSCHYAQWPQPQIRKQVSGLWIPQSGKRINIRKTAPQTVSHCIVHSCLGELTWAFWINKNSFFLLRYIFSDKRPVLLSTQVAPD